MYPSLSDEVFDENTVGHKADTQHHAPPHWMLLGAEFGRTIAEAGALFGSLPWLAGAPRGDGHPVLTLPGFTAGDASTLPLRSFLRQLGYEPIAWKLGQNTGRAELLEKLTRRFYRLRKTYGSPISIVGQSLGGVFARELARTFPDDVRFVITLGSPFGAQGAHATAPMVKALFHRMSGHTADTLRERLGNVDTVPAPPVPCTAVYSRTDGVVSWRSCLEQPSKQTENIEIVGSHSGMAVNPAVLGIIADRLAQPADNWKKFNNRSGLRRMVYPTTS